MNQYNSQGQNYNVDSDKIINDTVNNIHEIASILNTGLNRQLVYIIIALSEKGMEPQILAKIIESLIKKRHNYLNGLNM